LRRPPQCGPAQRRQPDRRWCALPGVPEPGVALL